MCSVICTMSESSSGRFHGSLHVPQRLASLLNHIAADDIAVTIERDLACEINRAAATDADRVMVIPRAGQRRWVEVTLVHWGLASFGLHFLSYVRLGLFDSSEDFVASLLNRSQVCIVPRPWAGGIVD